MSAGRSIEETDIVSRHVAACFDELYRSLAHAARLIDDDAIAVLCFDLSREFARERTRFEELLPGGIDQLDRAKRLAISVLSDAVNDATFADPHGTALLTVLANVLLPRVLVSLRDAADGCGTAEGGPLFETATSASTQVVAALRRIGDVVTRGDHYDMVAWRELTHRLNSDVEHAGYVDSFGLGVGG